MAASKLLIIDPVLANREIIRAILEADYFDIGELDDPIGLEDILISKSRPNLIISDSIFFERVNNIIHQDFIKRGASSLSLGRIPAVIMSETDDAEARAIALNSGIDDYLTRPYSPSELISRIKAILRRVCPHNDSETIEYKNLCLDPERHYVMSSEEPVSLVLTEFKLLHFFMTHPHRVYTRNQILDAVWGIDRFLDERTVNTYVRRLRAKLEDASADVEISSVRGVGYRFA